MTGYSVDLDELQTVAGRLGRFVAEYDTTLTQIAVRVDALDASWTGDAASAHRVSQEAWAAGARDMRDSAAAIEQIAVQAHSAYRAAVSANLRMFGPR